MNKYTIKIYQHCLIITPFQYNTTSKWKKNFKRVFLKTIDISSIYAAIVAWYGNRIQDSRWVESARNAVVLVFPLITLAAGTIIISLLNSDFSLKYVWEVSSIDMPLQYLL